MKVRDEAVWLKARADLATDGEKGQQMQAFVEDWCTRAEHALGDGREFQQEDGTWTGTNPAEALRAALPASEARCGQLSFSALIQATLIVLAVWEYGVEVFGYLTVIEKRAVLEMTAIKQRELELAGTGGKT